MNQRVALLGLSLGLLSGACSAGDDADPRESVGFAAEAEKWSTVDDPALFGGTLERNIGNLPLQGTADVTPWAGSYWRAAQDSINYRWAGINNPSATWKYQVAYGGYRVEDQVSAAFGVDSQPMGSYCYDDNQCDIAHGVQCGRRTGWGMGRCIPFWFGICNGWVAAAILTPEPTRRVQYNGIVFNVQDIKALASLMYTRAQVRMVSLTCRASDAGGTLAYDSAGRPAGQECRDTNPGTMHILLANFLGVQGKTFAEDRTFDAEIWNQPIRSYQVLDHHDVSPDEASQLVSGQDGTTYKWDRDAQKLQYFKTDVAYINEAASEQDGNLSSNIETYTAHDTYEYILELDGTGQIIGGEWAGASRKLHPDYLWLPVAMPSNAFVANSIRYDVVKGLLDTSVGD